MATFVSNAQYFAPEHANSTLRNHRQQIHQAHGDTNPPVKTEASASPDLPPASPSTTASNTSLQQFQFQFHSQPPPVFRSSSHSSRNPSEPPIPNNLGFIVQPPPPSIYRFGADASTAQYKLMSNNNTPNSQSWSSASDTSNGHNAANQGNNKFDLASIQHTMSFADEYDEVSELMDVGASGLAMLSGPGVSVGQGGSSSEKTIRRRSSKACDQCRKSKCKCERPAPEEPCRSCVMLGTPCTFLGPSRKRGPPKGYIDAIEARLHQTEALLGIMIAASDDRAQTLLRDIAKDPLAKEIINRVDNSPYGAKGRKRGDSNSGSKTRSGHAASGSESSPTGHKAESEHVDLQSTHPSNEWQDRVVSMLHNSSNSRGHRDDPHYPTPHPPRHPSRPQPYTSAFNSRSTVPTVRTTIRAPGPEQGVDGGFSPRRQRRRVDDFNYGDEYDYPQSAHRTTSESPRHTQSPVYPPRIAISSTSLARSLSPLNSNFPMNNGRERSRRRSTSSLDSGTSGSDDELTGAVGQLSLNEDEQVRYHGKASGLHLLGLKERVDGRNEGGIWRFPKARVWPALPSNAQSSRPAADDDELASQLPEPALQEHLLELYFTYVHPSFPVVHKRAFFEVYKAGRGGTDSPHSPGTDASSNASSSPFNRRRRRIPTLLLFAMLAIAARYSDDTAPPPSEPSTMWPAGDNYLNKAKIILDGSYASSRPSTCQALLLMGYREIGIGAMAQAWTYIGMAIRMAQDLGMHRSADGWARVGLGGRLFSEWELHERKRIWYACVIMDKYVSTYIGRPLSIFDRDFDTPLPSEDDPEEMEEFKRIPLESIDANHWVPKPPAENSSAVPGRIISCFNASSTLSGILSMIVQTIYAVHPVSSRHAESLYLEGLLDKWYLELPDHLRHEPGSMKAPIALPQVLVLHMQYWCAVLLLHRPFIRHPKHRSSSGNSEDGELRAIAEKSYEYCAGAANHITSILGVYSEEYCMDRSSVFLCYYIFTASIMHVTTLTAYPTDPQARLGLAKCMDALQKMEVVWPSAGRALELLRGAKVNLEEAELVKLANHPDRHKRSAEDILDDSFERNHLSNNANPDYLSLRTHSYGGAPNNYHAVYSDNGSMQQQQQPPAASPSSNPNAPYFPNGYDRWPSDNANALSYPTTLSTSVLPQLYSTGIVDERPSHVSSHNRLQSTTDQHGHPHRYPQYWNDYSTFPQLGTAYGAINDQIPMPQQQHSSTPQIYLPEQYNIYNNHPSSNS